MIIRELYYFDKETLEPSDEPHLDLENDESQLEKEDTRKTRLSLRQINKMRKASDYHNDEKVKELDFVRQMYGVAANAEASI
jgi:hypothetical protein